MSGYTPLFSKLLSGSLYGRWPHTGVWACLLSCTSREGLIDKKPKKVADAIGVPVETLLQCIDDFMQPDPESRTQAHEGRRLELIDPGRPWGWRVLNHGYHREKARKRNYDEQRTESGADAERKRQERAPRDVPTRPAVSHDVPLSSPSPSPTPTPSQEPPSVEGGPGGSRKRSPRRTAVRLPDDFLLTERRQAVAEAEGLPAERTFAKFCDYWRAASGAQARKHDWEATWRNWCRTEIDRARSAGLRPATPALPLRTADEIEAEELRRAAR